MCSLHMLGEGVLEEVSDSDPPSIQISPNQPKCGSFPLRGAAGHGESGASLCSFIQQMNIEET